MNEAVLNHSLASHVEEAGKGLLESQECRNNKGRVMVKKVTADEQYFFCDVVQVSEISITFWKCLENLRISFIY